MADRTSSEITVPAPRAAVMSVIADFAAYPEWASGVRSAEILEAGPDGRALQVRFELDAGIISDRYVLAYEWDGDAAVRWGLAGTASMMSEMSGAYLLADAVPAHPGSGTRVTYELAVGLRVPMIGMVRRRAEKAIVDTALKGLRTRVERGAGTGPGGGRG
jgi:carbon monoxide dehydrogenase subunit G